MYIDTVPNRNSPPAVLLRESCREAGKVKKRTLANLSKWPPALVQGLRVLLKGGIAGPRLEDAFDIVRSRPHGHVAAVLGTLRKLGLERIIAPQRSPERDRVVALVVARVLDPGSKRATGLAEATARDALAETLGLGALDEDDLYAAMDRLLARQERIEQGLAKRHLEQGALVLYDLTSVYLEGRRPLPLRLCGRFGGWAPDQVRTDSRGVRGDKWGSGAAPGSSGRRRGVWGGGLGLSSPWLTLQRNANVKVRHGQARTHHGASEPRNAFRRDHRGAGARPADGQSRHIA